jgi:hypothetical protein
MPNEPCNVFQRQQARSEQIRDDGSTTRLRPQPRRIETGLDGYEPDCTVDVLAKHRLALRRRKLHVGRRSLIRHNRPGITDHKPMGDLRRAVALKQPAHRRSEELSTGGPNRLCRPEDHPHNVGIRGAAPQGDNACLKIDVPPGGSKRFADPPALHVAKRDGGDESSVSQAPAQAASAHFRPLDTEPASIMPETNVVICSGRKACTRTPPRCDSTSDNCLRYVADVVVLTR